MIGPRAHSLTSINYSSAASVLLCGLALALIPGLSFALPTTIWQWTLMLVVTVCGFMFQLLLTEGLAYGAASAGPNGNGYRRVEDGHGLSSATGAAHRVNRAVGMMYTQVIFALIYDWSFFRHVPTLPSWAGILCIVLGAFWTGMSGN
ncbi:Integral membrane family protein [Apiospora saccharicola]